MSTGTVATGTVPGMVETLRRYGLLSQPQLDTVQNELRQRFSDPRALGAELLQRGWLTAYQLNQLLQGRAAQLHLEPYIVLERLGEGGTGQVFKARHQHMQRIAALKIIRKELLSDSEVLQRFYREMEVASQVSHPNVVHAYDAGPIGANHMLVMEYIEGIDLQRRIKESGPLPPAQACDYVRQAALGLHHIHECGLVHRDIKPSNLLVAHAPGSPAVVKILDLGLARLLPGNARQGNNQLTQLGTGMMGTPDYMAPEQAIDLSSADIRADIYSLGCTWCYLLTGQAPFPGGSLAQKLMRHQQAPIPSLRQLRTELPKSLDGILGRMLAKNPDDRYATPDAVARDLGEYLRSRGVGIDATQTPPRQLARPASLSGKPRRAARRKLQVSLLALLLLAGLVGAMFVLPDRGNTTKHSPPLMVPGDTPPSAVSSPPAKPPRQVLFHFDFEDGKLPAIFTSGKLVEGPRRPGNRFCLQGGPSGELGRIFLKQDAGLFTCADGLALVFDVWVDARCGPVDMNFWNRTQQASQGMESLRVPSEKWAEGIVVPIANFKFGPNGGPKTGDVIANLSIQTGLAGGTLYIDNLELIRVPVPPNK